MTKKELNERITRLVNRVDDQGERYNKGWEALQKYLGIEWVEEEFEGFRKKKEVYPIKSKEVRVYKKRVTTKNEKSQKKSRYDYLRANGRCVQCKSKVESSNSFGKLYSKCDKCRVSEKLNRSNNQE